MFSNSINASSFRPEIVALVDAVFSGQAAVLLLLLAIAVLSFLYAKTHRQARELTQVRLRHSAMFHAATKAVIVANADGIITNFNRHAEHVFGYSRTAAVGADIADLLVPEAKREGHRDGMKRFLASGEARILDRGPVKFQAMRANGEVFPIEFALTTIKEPAGPIFVAFIRDISEDVRVQVDLTRARDDAVAGARTKSRFLAVMSHEMRTPLNGVLAGLDLLATTELDEEQQRFVGIAIRSGELLQRHIDDVLQISRLESRQFDLHRVVFNIKNLVDELIAMNIEPAAANGNKIFLECTLDDTEIYEDRDRIAQILLNLIGNAIKFTRDGRILVELRTMAGEGGGSMLELVVGDNGAGIAEDDIERIFETYVTLDPTNQQATTGFGLGLAICKQLAQAMGGDISVESRKGYYSRFCVRLPLHQPPASAQTKSVRSPEPRRLGLRKNAPGLRVLLVEDNANNRIVAHAMLARFGCTVTEAVDGMEGVARAEAERFDLILMDVNMPNLGGLDATRRIRESDTSLSRRSTIVGLTAHALPEEQQLLRQSGMQDCLIKPIRARYLRDLIARLVEFRDSGVAANQGETDKPSEGDVDAPDDQDEFIDEDVFNELSAVLDRQVLDKRLDMFQAELETLDQSLRKSWSDTEVQDVGKTAHKYAGSAAVFGASGLRELMSAIEGAVSQGDAEQISLLLDEVPWVVAKTNKTFERVRLG